MHVLQCIVFHQKNMNDNLSIRLSCQKNWTVEAVCIYKVIKTYWIRHYVAQLLLPIAEYNIHSILIRTKKLMIITSETIRIIHFEQKKKKCSQTMRTYQLFVSVCCLWRMKLLSIWRLSSNPIICIMQFTILTIDLAHSALVDLFIFKYIEKQKHWTQVSKHKLVFFLFCSFVRLMQFGPDRLCIKLNSTNNKQLCTLFTILCW